MQFSYVSIQGSSGPMVLHKCLALVTCINAIESGFFSQNLPKNPEKANSVKRSQTQLDLERMQVARARHLCRTIGPLCEQKPGFDSVKPHVKPGYFMIYATLHRRARFGKFFNFLTSTLILIVTK